MTSTRQCQSNELDSTQSSPKSDYNLYGHKKWWGFTPNDLIILKKSDRNSGKSIRDTPFLVPLPITNKSANC